MHIGMGSTMSTVCPGPGCPVGTWDASPPSTTDYTPQLQAEIDALYAYTHAGQSAAEPVVGEAAIARDCGCGVVVPRSATCPTLRADCGGMSAASSQWFKGLDNSTVLIAGAVVAAAVLFGRSRR